MLSSINWPNFNFWLSLILEILGNTYIVIIRLPVSDVLNFEIKKVLKVFLSVKLTFT